LQLTLRSSTIKELREEPLPASARDGSMPSEPAFLESTRSYTPPVGPGEVIAGRYKLLEAIGQGGMGTVYVAEQSEPVRRKVALKLIKLGMDSASVVARFEAERQALALMDHPNIAKVLDGGLSEAGRPFFVMEHVKGVPISAYCDSARLSIRERLQLFVLVCDAVQHAHQKGIIHRDLKPSNILVAVCDDRPVPKVIDFGLAKAMHQPLTERTIHTAQDTVLGTPPYMAPEQAQLANLDVDTRADIYSLGVLLYELLTGTTPLEKRRFKEVGWEEARRIIREEEPPRPSIRLSTSGTLPDLASCRRTDPAGLTRLVRGELDWIVMKALEKDRSRRYATANGLAMDVQRYLDGDAVLAVPPSAGYRLRKFARKHQAAVAVTALFTCLLVAGITGTIVGIIEARAAAEAEKKTGHEAGRRFQQLQKANEILTSIFSDLDIHKVKEGTEPLEAVLAKRLVNAAEHLEGEAVGDAKVVAGLQNQLGVSLLHLGYPQEAIPLFTKALATRRSQMGGDHFETLASMNNLALAYGDAGKPNQALPLFEETVKLMKARFGLDNRSTLNAMNNLATGYQTAGKLDLALPLLEESLRLVRAKLGAENPETLTSMNNLAAAYQAAGKLDLAGPLFKDAFKLMSNKLGPDHPRTLIAMDNLANYYQESGKLDLGLSLAQDAVKRLKARLGAGHRDTLIGTNNLASRYRAAGKLDLALPLAEETVKLMKIHLSADHPYTLLALRNLGECCLAAGKLDLALPCFQEAAAGMEQQRFQHRRAGEVIGGLIGCHERLKQFSQAETWRRKWLAVIKAKPGSDSVDYARQLAGLGWDLLEQQKWTDAEAVLRDSFAIRQKKEPDAWTTFNTQSMLGGALLGQKRYDDARPLLLQGYKGMKARAAKIPPQAQIRLSQAVERLVALWTSTGRTDEAASWRKELETVGRRVAP
jgi:serine/threonine protein kinase